jgi:hypothetical protein
MHSAVAAAAVFSLFASSAYAQLTNLISNLTDGKRFVSLN